MYSGSLQLLPTPCNKKIKGSPFHLNYTIDEFEIQLQYTMDTTLFDQFSPKQKIQNASTRKDKLWESNCLEFFIKPLEINSYIELNFSLSGDWNAFNFDNYRQNKTESSIFSLNSFRVEKQEEDNLVSAHYCLGTERFIQCHSLHGCAIIFLDNTPCYFHNLPESQSPPDFHKFHK
jgi:hypothetical protein